MRLFVAVVLPPGVTAELAAALDRVRPQWPGLRWTGPESWHVTLAFLGEVSETVVPELSTRLERAARRHPAQELAISGTGTFPGPSRAQVVWAGLRADLPALGALAASVAAGARRAGAPTPDEGRRFRPHITLARLRAPGDVRPLLTELGGLATPPWTATGIELIRSHLPAPGPGRPAPGARPVYERLAGWPLRAAAESEPGS
jgi:2'-5' RNA ligase